MDSLREWLIQLEAAAAVKELVVADAHSYIHYRSYAAVLPLPAPQLQQLQKLGLFRCRLSVDKTENYQIAVSCLTSLTSLVLEGVELRSGVRGLSALTGLQELQLSKFPRGAQNLWQEMQYCLCSLTQLTRLVVDVETLPQGAVAMFDCLQQLQELTVYGVISSFKSLLRLPQSLTKLELISMQQLRLLHMHGLLSSDALPTLARVLPALYCLESLIITNSSKDLEPMPASDARYSALLQLSLHLTRLELSLEGPLDEWRRETVGILRAAEAAAEAASAGAT
uniref:Uncharacterized protein n=1 Tax=Tetradesmus obliquus TaxID=3088 RepID=A0A383V9U7_TETOB|eukprot:jgi/Sobl393_1/6894/SZX61710.1